LGGAIVIQTKDGFKNSGTSANIHAGSFGRVGIQAETGGSTSERFSYFLTGEYLQEDGWRDHSPSEVTQLFGNLGWHMAATTIDFNVTLVATDLIGNGAAPVELLEVDPAAVFTRPDQTENELSLVNVTVEHELSSTLSLAGNAYVRRSDISTYNGDDSDFEECTATPGFICDEEGILAFDPSDDPIPAIAAFDGATINRTNTEQDSVGFGLQSSWSRDLSGRDNVFVLGTSYDDSSIDFGGNTELGRLDATRLAVPGGALVGDSFTRLKTDTTSWSLFFSNTFALTEAVSLTLSGRYNDIAVTLDDQLGTALDGDHKFDRFNTAAGVTAKLSQRMTFYAGFSESNRTPSPVELTCADEDDPCRLPNAFLADPPLQQVVARTYESGFRGTWQSGRWQAGVFRTTNEDDILFISAGALRNQGYFDNVGQTRREGLEINLDGQAGDSVDWLFNYTFLKATFRENLTLPSPNNPLAVDGEVSVQVGDRLPLIPRQLFKAGIRASIGERITIAGQALFGSTFHMRGDEGNDLAPVGEYSLLNVRADYLLNDHAQIFLNIDNVLNEEYLTFGLFGEADEVLGSDFDDSRFVSPGAPRAAWLGLQLTF
ncbi:MAG: TonB-dependent receptor, partial [Rhodothermales bacterium]|nr:TonB-dependent receptor [Rhodothermales bacterium]